MSSNETDGIRPRAESTGTRRPDAIELESTLVRNEQGANRRTVYPRGVSDVTRMSTWLSADSDVFVDVETIR